MSDGWIQYYQLIKFTIKSIKVGMMTGNRKSVAPEIFEQLIISKIVGTFVIFFPKSVFISVLSHSRINHHTLLLPSPLYPSSLTLAFKDAVLLVIKRVRCLNLPTLLTTSNGWSRIR